MPENKCTPRDKICSNTRVYPEQAQSPTSSHCEGWQIGAIQPGDSSLCSVWPGSKKPHLPGPGPSLTPARVCAEVRGSRGTLWNPLLEKHPSLSSKLFTTCLFKDLYFRRQKIIKIVCTDTLPMPLPVSTVSGLSPTAQKLNTGALQGAVHLSHGTPAHTLPSPPVQPHVLLASGLPQRSDALCNALWTSLKKV